MSYLTVSTNESVGAALKTLGHNIIKNASTLNPLTKNAAYNRFKSIYDINKIKPKLIKKLQSLNINGDKIHKITIRNWKDEQNYIHNTYDGCNEKHRKEASKEHSASITPFKITASVPIHLGYYKKKDPYFNTVENLPQYYMLYITFDSDKIYDVSADVTKDKYDQRGCVYFHPKQAKINDPSLIQLLNSCKK